MISMYKKELRSYYTSPLGYVIIGIFLFIAGLMFTNVSLGYGYTDLSIVLNQMTIVFIVIVPLLTMKLLAEEKSTKTDQILLTSPVTVMDVVLGKFLAAATFYLIMLCSTSVYLLIIVPKGQPPAMQIFGSYIGYFLLGSALISIGLFVSSLTENQIVSAVTSFGVMLVSILLQIPIDMYAPENLKKALNALSVFRRFDDFPQGLLNVPSIVYYLSIMAIFIFLTSSVIERRRWN